MSAITRETVLAVLQEVAAPLAEDYLVRLLERVPEDRHRLRLNRTLCKLKKAGQVVQQGRDTWSCKAALVTRDPPPLPQPPTPPSEPAPTPGPSDNGEEAPFAAYRRLLLRHGRDYNAPEVKAFYEEHFDDLEFRQRADTLKRLERKPRKR